MFPWVRARRNRYLLNFEPPCSARWRQRYSKLRTPSEPMSDVVRALNDARTAPRRARFDPRAIREGSAAGAGSGTDVSAIPFGENRFYQVVDTGTARFNYALSVPGVSTFSLAGALRQAGTFDPQRLESLIQNLRDESRQAEAYLAIAELRFAKVAAELPTQTR